MQSYAAVLNYAIPFFLVLIGLEWIAGRLMGVQTLRSMDAIASLSSGFTNVIKDVLRLTVVVVGYKFLVAHLALFQLQAHWWVFVLAFVGKDFVGYVHHVIDHKVNFFWNEHLAHHSSEDFNLPCALRQPISILISFWGLLYIPLAVLGVPAEVVGVVAPLHLFAQFWYHTRIIKKLGFLEYIIVTPSHHRVHHAINPEYMDKNFGQIFIFWDKIFGTFQEELKDVPAVYGVKRPVQTWNPFLINFQHFWLLAKDAWRTKRWWDKVRIWWMPTGWRPADVQEKFPVPAIEDVYQVEKYAPPASTPLVIWAWLQLGLTMGLILYLFNHLDQLQSEQMLWYAGFLGMNIFSYTFLMDRSMHAWWLSLITSGLGLGLIWKENGWFGIDSLFSLGNELVVLYLVLSFILALTFTLVEFRKKIPALQPTS
ncbi:MAG: sterol desaturase family protein [Bacteroidia bacterium]|nr:sterol desaturase family protein [Bacteroidia bacterium]